ncbi:transmembrane protein, putative [Medicago truncatula]|uniref:Transmembrane protein, putative n=1 Tax=Medicago truncatula TaxID=3880 RepID=G7KPF8_MEDTR|nr:transmembrane protein, putative [Medicago truncatula]
MGITNHSSLQENEKDTKEGNDEDEEVSEMEVTKEEDSDEDQLSSLAEGIATTTVVSHWIILSLSLILFISVSSILII